jgi:hypothetical protein
VVTTAAPGPEVEEAMTETRPAKKPRWSRGQIRFLAWVSGSAAFLAFVGAIGISPKPAVANGAVAGAPRRPVPRQTVLVRRITRRVVIIDPPTPTYSSGSPGYIPSYTPTYTTGSTYPSGGTVAAAPPPPPPPPVSTGGSTPPP